MSDASVVSLNTSGKRATRPGSKIAAGFLLPLFFVVLFPLMFVSATHNPTPRELPILVVGPDQVVAKIATALDDTDEFAASQTDVPEEARSSVEHRWVDGAIEVSVNPSSQDAQPTANSAAPSFTVTTYVANGAGRAVAAAVQSAGDNVASELGTTSAVVDVAPLSPEDPLGINLFYLLTFTTLGAYLVIIVLMQVAPKAALSTRFIAVGITSVAAPSIVFGLSSIFVGDYGASLGTIAGLLGVNALYVFTIGTAAILIEQLLGKAATFGVMAFIVFMNFPSAGGSVPGALLPGFWQAIHNVYFGSGAYESFRSIIYFDGNGASRWLLQLLAWTVGLILVNFVVYLAKTVRHQRHEIADLARVAALRDSETDVDPHAAEPRTTPAPTDTLDRNEPKVEMLDLDLELDLPQRSREEGRRRSITASEGVTR